MKLEIGYNDRFEVRAIDFRYDGGMPFSVIYISDLHCTRFSGPIVLRLIDCINALKPDIILFGGDYVDSKKGLQHLAFLLAGIRHHPHVFAIAGNHDHFFGLESVRQMFVQQGVQWIDHQSVQFELHGRIIRIDGTAPGPFPSTADFNILCLHHPRQTINLHAYNYQLALAGHLHGCQFVLFQHGQALYPGKFFYPMNILAQRLPNGHYLVSRGMGDTLPLRLNCAKEIILARVGQKIIT